MRITIDLPENLILKALAISNFKTKTSVIIYALENLIKQEKVRKIKKYKGKVKLKIDLDALRQSENIKVKELEKKQIKGYKKKPVKNKEFDVWKKEQIWKEFDHERKIKF
jgi:hypothetical protein